MILSAVDFIRCRKLAVSNSAALRCCVSATNSLALCPLTIGMSGYRHMSAPDSSDTCPEDHQEYNHDKSYLLIILDNSHIITEFFTAAPCASCCRGPLHRAHISPAAPPCNYTHAPTGMAHSHHTCGDAASQTAPVSTPRGPSRPRHAARMHAPQAPPGIQPHHTDVCTTHSLNSSTHTRMAAPTHVALQATLGVNSLRHAS